MPHLCITVLGQRHCFEIPLLVEIPKVRVPPPTNYPELEALLTVRELLKVVQPQVANSQSLKELNEVSSKLIHEIQAGLPKGVGLILDGEGASKDY